MKSPDPIDECQSPHSTLRLNAKTFTHSPLRFAMPRRNRHRRNGNILVMTALLMMTLMALLAFAIDLGYLYAVRTELQRSADSAAIAAAWELIDKEGQAG